MAIYIQIKLFATLNKFLPQSSDNYPVSDRTTVIELIQLLKIPESDAKLIFINGIKTSLTYVLKHGDRIGIFPPVGGG